MVLSLTVGLLVFLLIDTLLEAFEVSALLPEVYQGVPLVLFAALLTWLGINAVSTRGAKERRERTPDPAPSSPSRCASMPDCTSPSTDSRDVSTPATGAMPAARHACRNHPRPAP